jgi:hypothetical protein
MSILTTFTRPSSFVTIIELGDPGRLEGGEKNNMKDKRTRSSIRHLPFFDNDSRSSATI